MRVEFDYTFADLKEGTTPENEGGSAHGARSNVRILVSITLLVAMFAAGGIFVAGTSGELPASAAPQELSLTLLPSLVPAIIISLIIALGIISGWRKASQRKAAPRRSTPARAIAVVYFYVVVLVLTGAIVWVTTPSLALTWRPTRSQLIAVNLAPWAIIILALVLWGLLQPGWSVRQQWHGKPAWKRRRTIELSDEGIHISDELTDYRFRWGFFTRARETQNLLILQSEENLLYLIPKRAVPEEQLDQLRGLICNKVPECKFLTPPPAFPVLPKPVIPAAVTS